LTRLGGAFWFVLVIASGVTNFVVKQTVQGLDDKLTSVRRQTIVEQKKIHELTADWTYLNQPELLTNLNTRYVHLVQLSPKQVQTTLDNVPLRPVPTQTLDIAPQIAMAAPTTMPAPEIAPPAPTATATANPPATPNPAPIVPVSATSPAHNAALPAANEPAPARPAPASRAASLDSLFAQVSGDR
jgi:hypothetical protein